MNFNRLVMTALVFVFIAGFSTSCGIKGKLKIPSDSKMNRVYPYE